MIFYTIVLHIAHVIDSLFRNNESFLWNLVQFTNAFAITFRCIWAKLEKKLLSPVKYTELDSSCITPLQLALLWWKEHGLDFNSVQLKHILNTMKLRQNGHHFADDIFKQIFGTTIIPFLFNFTERYYRGFNCQYDSMVQIIAWHRSGDKPLSEPMQA